LSSESEEFLERPKPPEPAPSEQPKPQALPERSRAEKPVQRGKKTSQRGKAREQSQAIEADSFFLSKMRSRIRVDKIPPGFDGDVDAYLDWIILDHLKRGGDSDGDGAAVKRETSGNHVTFDLRNARGVHFQGLEANVGNKRDEYNNERANIGAQGPNAKAKKNTLTYNEVWGEDGATLKNPAALVDELARLREELTSRSEGKDGADAAILAVTKAEAAAKKSDGSKVLGFLRTAGGWTLEVAKDIGVQIAAETIMRSMKGQ
jgi:hypothetical protein